MTKRNWHSIVGPNGICECGVQPDGSFAKCGELLKAERAEAAEQRVGAVEAALRTLIIDANRLCDRQLGGTYEDDCRRSIERAKAALGEAALSPQAKETETAGSSVLVDVPDVGSYDAICPKCGHYFETDIPEQAALPPQEPTE